MIGSRVRVKRKAGLPDDIKQGVINALLRASDRGFEVSQDKVPVGATSGLKMSGVPPKWLGDRIVWGYTAPYAPDVEEGTDPHHVPIEPLEVWARRVLGDESLAGAVQTKIEQKGTDAQPFVEPGIDAMLEELRGTGFTFYIRKERNR